MTTAWLGIASFDELLWRDSNPLDTGISTPGYGLCTNLMPVKYDADAGDSVVGSRGAIQVVALEHNWATGFAARTQDVISYHFWIRAIQLQHDASGSSVVLMTSHGSGNTAPDGAVRVIGVTTDSTHFTPYLQVKSGGAWSTFSVAGTSVTVPTGHQLWCLQVDLGTTKRARLIIDGTADIAWTNNTNIAAAGVIGTPSPGGLTVGGKSGSTITCTYSSCMVIDNADATEAGTGLSTSYQVYARYPVSDVSVGNWGATGSSGGLYRSVDDAEDLADDANDYLTESSASANDVLFEVYNSEATGGDTVECVSAVAVAKHSSGNGGNLSLFCKLSGTEHASTTATSGYPGSTGSTWYIVWPKDPAGNAWTASNFDSTQFGIRAAASNAPEVYGYVINICGTGLARQVDKAPIPPASFVPMVMIF